MDIKTKDLFGLKTRKNQNGINRKKIKILLGGDISKIIRYKIIFNC